MKHNLKNRPKYIEVDGQGMITYRIQEIKDWFEGFEKELREILRREEKLILDVEPRSIDILEEILGE